MIRFERVLWIFALLIRRTGDGKIDIFFDELSEYAKSQKREERAGCIHKLFTFSLWRMTALLSVRASWICVGAALKKNQVLEKHPPLP